MQIHSRLAISADGYVTTPDGWPAQLADPAFAPGTSHGIPEFLVGKEAALMGRTTFEPALGVDRWPWPNLDVFVLASERPAGTPDHVVTDNDPVRLLEKLRAANEAVTSTSSADRGRSRPSARSGCSTSSSSSCCRCSSATACA